MLLSSPPLRQGLELVGEAAQSRHHQISVAWQRIRRNLHLRNKKDLPCRKMAESGLGGIWDPIGFLP